MSISSFIRLHELSGGQALIAKNLLEQGLTGEQTEYQLLEFGSDLMEQFLALEIYIRLVKPRRKCAEDLRNAFPDNRNIEKVIKELGRNADFYENSMHKLFPRVGKEY